MQTHQLLVALATAKNDDTVEAVLDEFAEACGWDDHTQLPTRLFGDRQNNRSSVEAMIAVEHAIYEKISNGHDAVTEFMQQTSGFLTDPRTPTEALKEIGDRFNSKEDVPGVYVGLTTTEVKSTGGRPKKLSNILILDEGIGIPRLKMPTTILSLNGSNKLSNPLTAGNYGHGGSAIHRTAKFALIYSISHLDPEIVSFTVVFSRHKDGDVFPAYVYLVGADSEVFSCNVGDLPSSKISTPEDLDRSSSESVEESIIDVLEGKLILPEHGTAVKVWNQDAFTGNPETQAFIRDRGFSMQVQTRLRSGIRSSKADDGLGTNRRRNNVIGIRRTLETDSSVAYLSLAHDRREREVLGGEASMEYWVRDRDPEGRAVVKAAKPVDVITSIKDRSNTPIYVTLNGMTHANLNINVLLRNANLAFLVGHILMEIDCDRMSIPMRGQYFVANREGVTKEMEDKLKYDIFRFLKNESEDENSPLTKANALIRDRVLRDEGGKDNQAFVENFARIMRTRFAGSLFSRWGASFLTTVDNGKGDVLKGGATTNHDLGPKTNIIPRKKKLLALKPVPTEISVHKATIQLGQEEYIKVTVNAFDDWHPGLSIHLPSFLKLINAPVLKGGRISYLVRTTDGAAIGDTGVVRVVMDKTVKGQPGCLEAQCEIEVVRRTQEEPKTVVRGPGAGQKTGLPEFILRPVEPGMEGWEHVSDGSIPDPQIAMKYMKSDDKVIIFWNRLFEPLTKASEHVLKSFKSEAALDKLKNDYQIYLQLLALAHLSSGDENDARDIDSATMRGWSEAIKANTLMIAMSFDKGSVSALNEVADSEDDEINEAA